MFKTFRKEIDFAVFFKNKNPLLIEIKTSDDALSGSFKIFY